MDANKLTESTQIKPLRLWPGVVFVILQWIFRYIVPIIDPEAIMLGVLAIVIFGFAIVVWWLFFSRAPRFERWVAIPIMILALIGTSQLLDKSIATANMGLMFTMYSIPIMCLAFVAWAVFSQKLSVACRRRSMFATILLASGFWIFLRTDGMDAEIHHDLKWRWAKSAEERLLEKNGNRFQTAKVDSTAKAMEPEWAGFRGSNRNGIVHGLQIKTDWTNNPPVELWRRSVGPGCSSFAVHGNLLLTQEQRGEYEMVTCYNLKTGEPIWAHRDSARFWDAHAGAGPRSTPTLYKGLVYTLGATGILNVLDEQSGSVIWTRNAAMDTKVKIPGWGYTGSPLVVDSTVFVSISGQMLAYNMANGKLKWTGTDGGESYSSPQLLVSNGVKQILFTNNEGLKSYSPIDGHILWNLSWPGIRVVQPGLVDENNILVNQEERKSLKRIELKNGSNDWTFTEKWTTDNLKLDYNDLVINKGYAYGFEGLSLTCIDIENGNRMWKGGRYGGQILLLADQDIMLVLSEKGDLALVKAAPEAFKELAHYPAIKGKTWNHPVLVGNILIVRNTEEMAAFKLP